ncbi:DUF2784 domain-containing protein [Sulfurirhabdus autotrophica]|uniref:Uncharacterized protein DUF2784 n=1 Tax=Sulfurirhabdus autotrophica TaxID=1706046 RepID=A0A4R3XXJ4_9PROT|nr:DUF2784 domain-containing protein [Sulfurirhabdus autotrophica]TCV82343.1 uncharacterized protein DUF2784 [Sulfurirhabdus autotrophica]
MRLLADTVLVIHFFFVLFVVVGLCLIWIGAFRNWQWIRNFWFRILHLLAILFVAIETLFGKVCPLTTWEDLLRGTRTTQPGFIQRWVSRLLFYDFPETVFTVIYLIFAMAVILSMIVIKPTLPQKYSSKPPEPFSDT